MTEYGRERERRRKWRTLVQGLVAVCATARLAVTVGLVTAVLAALAFLVVAFGVGALVIWCRRGPDAAAGGSYAVWPCQKSSLTALKIAAQTGKKRCADCTAWRGSIRNCRTSSPS
jgi:hypothetical protein